MVRTYTWRQEQTDRWINRRFHYCTAIWQHTPPKDNRFNKWTDSPSYDMGRDQNYVESFSRNRHSFYENLNQHENLKW